MSKLFNNFPQLFFAPDLPSGTGSNSGTPGGSKDLSADDIYDLLGDDTPEAQIPADKKKEPEPKGKKEDKKDDETPDEGEESPDEDKTDEEDDDELKQLEKELEDEEKEPSDEDIQLVSPVRRQEILKKYPNFFKDFPYMEVAWYRDRQFTEVFPTPKDAKVAAEAQEILQRFETDVMKGNTETILKAVKEESPQTFNRVVDNYLTTLANVDQNAYYHVLGNIGRHTIIGMVQEARRLGINNDPQNPGAGNVLQQAAQILNQFLFGSSEFTPPRNLSTESKPEDRQKENEFNEQRQRFITQQFEYSRNDLNTRINTGIQNTISQNIDPNKAMSDYVRNSAEREAMETLEMLFSKDVAFNKLKDKLWERAFQDGFSQESLAKIRTAYNAKARSLLPAVLKKARINAYRGMGKRVRETVDEEQTQNKGPVKGGRPHTPQSGKTGRITNPKDIPAGMSSLEFLNSD